MDAASSNEAFALKYIILMAYGSPTRISDVPEYLKGIYEGRPVPEYAMKENMEKYRMFGGTSPSNAIVESLVSRIGHYLSQHGDYQVRLGNKHWEPWLKDLISQISPSDEDSIIAFPLFPFPSENVKNSYLEPLEQALSSIGSNPRVRFINGIPADALSRIWSPIVESSYQEGDAVLFDAHSLPIFRGNEDDYNSAFFEAARKISEDSGVQEYFVGYQSRGKYGSRWLEPSIYDVLERIISKGYRSIMAVPVGFLYEHLEILYDLDYEFGGKVKELGMHYHRTALPDDGEVIVEELSRLVMTGE